MRHQNNKGTWYLHSTDNRSGTPFYFFSHGKPLVELNLPEGLTIQECWNGTPNVKATPEYIAKKQIVAKEKKELAQKSKPQPVCRRCGWPLQVGVNWYEGRQKHHDRICKTCFVLQGDREARLRRKRERAILRRKLTTEEAKEKLGGKCQLCGSVENLEFAHLWYDDYEIEDRRSCKEHIVAFEVLKKPEKFLLLCEDCHHHPEKWLKQLIDLKRLVEPVNAEISVPTEIRD